MKRRNGHGLSREISTNTQRDFMKMTGLSSELDNFLVDFMGNPDLFFSMSDKKKNDIESQMDAILSRMIAISYRIFRINLNLILIRF
jgi:hypothetical protein